MSSLATPGPEPDGTCPTCGGNLERYGRPCGFCEAVDELYESERYARFEAYCEEVYERLIADRVGGLCRPIRGGAS